MGVARIVRGQVLALKEREFIEAAVALGSSSNRIVVRHLLPNSIGPILVALTTSVVAAIVAESTLSFFGFGTEPGHRARRWGTLLADSKGDVLTGNWWLVVFPCRRVRADDPVHQLRRRRAARRLRPEAGRQLMSDVDPATTAQPLTDVDLDDVDDLDELPPPPPGTPVLQLDDFRVSFPTLFGDVQAVRGIDLDVDAGEMVGIVGESGSGKSVTFLGLMGLLPPKSALIAGSAKVDGHRAGRRADEDGPTASAASGWR